MKGRKVRLSSNLLLNHSNLDNEHLKRLFVESSNNLGSWLERKLEAVLSISLNTESRDARKSIKEFSSIRNEVKEFV